MMTVDEVLAHIGRQRGRRQSNKVLHGHPSPLLWEEDALSDVLAERRQVAAHSGRKRVSLYVATPYCLPTDPDRCGFCLFPSEVFLGQAQLEKYLRYLALEGELYKPWFQRAGVGSIYFGGGTANLYRAEVYPQLLEIVRGVFGELPSGIEVTLEGIPQLFSRPKLEAMKAAGFNRISIGVQQLQNHLIKLSGRKQSARQVFQTLEWCEALGLVSSVDLIFGWPQQTASQMLSDLHAVVATGVRHITHYELNVAGRSDFASNHRDTLPTLQQNLEMYHLGREYLLSQGFRQATAYDWEKPEDTAQPIGAGRYVFEEQLREVVSTDSEKGYEMWGWGFAGCSWFTAGPANPGWSYMNSTRVEDYFAHLDAGRFPVERAFRHDVADIKLNWLFQRMQSMFLPAHEYESIFGRPLLQELAPFWEAFAQQGWVSRDAEGVRLVGDGPFFTPLMQALLAQGRVDELRRRQGGRPVLAPVPVPTQLRPGL